MSELVLHHYWRSSCSWRVRWAMNLKKLDYRLIPVDLLSNKQSSSEYVDISATGLVPTLEYGDAFISESLAIIEWLEEKFDGQSVLPGNATDRSRIRQMAYTIACGVQPIQNLKVQKYISENPDERLSFARHWIEEGFAAFEKLSQQHSVTFSYGSEITLADICLIPQVYNAKRFKVDLGKFPTISKVYDQCLNTLECSQSAPENYDPNKD